MATCAQCGVKVVLPYQCKHCGAYLCPDHHLPENHACSRPTKRNRQEVRAHTSTPSETPRISRSNKFGSIIKLLKKKTVIILLVFLVMTSIWVGIYSGSSLTVRQEYQQSLILSSIFFVIMFVMGFAMVVTPKRRWVAVGRTVTRTRGHWGGMNGGEKSVSTTQIPVEREPLYKSGRFIKRCIIIGGILALFGFSFGILSFVICYAATAIGGMLLGCGVALLITGGRY